MRRKSALIISVICLGLLSACGIRGDLKRPDPIVKGTEQTQPQTGNTPANPASLQKDATASSPN